MIRTIIQAGFGNQLFQYATAYALSKEMGQELELDISFFDYVKKKSSYNARVNNLDKLRLDNPIFINEPDQYWKYRFGAKICFPRSKKIKGANIPIIWEDVANCRKDQSHLFAKDISMGVVLFGFWQNFVYFEKHIMDLKRQFVPNYILSTETNNVLNKIRSTVSVGVHVRRGDFVTLGWAKGAEYYDQSMKWVLAQISDPDCRFFIVSDDYLWAKEQFEGRENVSIVNINSTTKDIDEFFLLSSCKHQIISESSFGWWAAYLNTNPDKFVVVPKDADGNIFERDWRKI